MRQFLITSLLSLLFLIIGLVAGVCLAPQIKSSPPALWLSSQASKLPGAVPDKDSPFESYDYPTIKWRAKPLAEAQGAIAQLSTRYESAEPSQPGRMNYKLTVFKAPGKGQCEIQLLDDAGFKLMQFDATDFHQIPGTADIMEARDSHACTEEEYRRVRDYSIK